MTVWSKNGDDYNHNGDSAGDGEAEAGEEGAYVAMLEGRDNSKRRPSLLRRSGSRAGSVRRDCATKVGRGWSTASYRWSSIMGAEAEGLAAFMSSSLTDVEMLEGDTTTKCDK